MERKYIYAGYSDGCCVASNLIGSNADILEAKMKQLHDDNISGNIDLSVPLNNIFNSDENRDLYRHKIGGLNGDAFIIDNLNPFNPAWKGHYAKINGGWYCSSKLSKVIGLMFFGKEPAFRRKHKDYTGIIVAIGNYSAGSWMSYTQIVNKISELNDCGIGTAKNLMSKFISDGYFEKNKIHNSYKVFGYQMKINNDTIQPIVDKQKKGVKYRIFDKAAFDGSAKFPVKDKSRFENNPYLDLIGSDGYSDDLINDNELYEFITGYIKDDRIVADAWYTIDEWIDKRVDAQGWTANSIVKAMLNLIELGYVSVNYDEWMITFHKDCTRDFRNDL